MRDMIIFNNHNDHFPSSSRHLIKCLRNIGRVIWVDIHHEYAAANSQPCRHSEHFLSKSEKFFYGFTQSRHIFVEMNQVSPIQSAKERQEAILRILQVLQPVLRKHHVSAPIIWTSELYIADLQSHLSGASLVYYCNEESVADTVTDTQLKFEQEQTMVRNANVIFCSNDIICSRFPRNKTLLLPQAVDTELFCQPTVIAHDMPKQDKPIAGFYGELDDHIDYQLLYYSALNLPDWNFLFIGKNKLSNYPLPRLANIHYLGPKPHCDLPSYSQHWQASLLPYKREIVPPLTIETTLLEYLAVGAPIITTSTYCIKSYTKYINVVESAHEMSEALRLATYEQKTPSDLVISDSWQVRSNFVSRILENL